MFPLRKAAEQSLLNFGSADPSFKIPNLLPLPFSSLSGLGLTETAHRVYITYSRFLEIGPAPGCSAVSRSNHNPDCVALFEAAFGEPAEGRPAASAPPPDPASFLSFEHFDSPDVVPKPDDNDDDVVERAAADILARLEPEEELYEPSFAGDCGAKIPLRTLKRKRLMLQQPLRRTSLGITFQVPLCCTGSVAIRILCWAGLVKIVEFKL